MAILVYFTDEAGNELRFSGYEFAWTGAWAPGRRETARTQIEVTRNKKRFMLTSASFGGKTVRVKIWAPRGSEYFDLVPGPVQQVDLPTEWVTAA